jgi:uncharacterized iron-regulated membrane protein
MAESLAAMLRGLWLNVHLWAGIRLAIPVRAVIVFLAGVFPIIFASTGVVMWLRRRANRRQMMANSRPEVRPAA